MLHKYLILTLAFFQLYACTGYAKEECHLFSPDKKLKISVVQNAEGDFCYTLSVNKEVVIEKSLMGFETESGKRIPSKSWNLEEVERQRIKDVWHPLWGKRESVPDEYNEMKLILNSTVNEKIEIIARAYNDGVAFRYIVPEGGMQEQKVTSELTRYSFAGDYTAWYYNFEMHNIGPERLTETDEERMPVMTVKVEDDLYLALHEACLEEGQPMKLKSEKGDTSFTLVSKPQALYGGYQSAWRVIFCGSTPGALVDSHLLELLNPAPEEDFSWVKPGIALWDWRIDGAEWEGFKYTMTYPSWVRMVDFAAEQGFAYLVLDANWYGPEFSEESDPVKGDKAKDVQKIIQYGKTKNVGIWLYLNDVAGKSYSLEETLQQYAHWGAAGVKYGFMFGGEEEKNLLTKRITEICAQNKLLINFHDQPIHPYGQMRTWPNAVTREYCKAQLDGYDVFYPKTFVTSVFVNMIAGPIDMNNGMFDLRQGKTTRVDNNQEVPSTLVSETARTLITYSGVTIIPDIPEYYRKYPELLDFLSSQKMPWKESKTLSGSIGEYIVMMRQSQDDTYLIGVATNEEGRNLDISLAFLPKGNYRAEIIEDGEEAHYLTNREIYRVSHKNVTRKETLSLKLAPGGGACVKIVSVKR